MLYKGEYNIDEYHVLCRARCSCYVHHTRRSGKYATSWLINIFNNFYIDMLRVLCVEPYTPKGSVIMEMSCETFR